MMLRFVAPFLIVSFGMPGLSRAQDNQLAPQEKSAGWQSLFNGKDMSGWDDPRQKTPPGDGWTIEDGCLKACAHPRIEEDLFTRETFHDFDLAFDWRISASGNSGVKYRVQDHIFVLDGLTGRFEDFVNLSLQRRRADRPARGQDYNVAFEYQVIDNRGNGDAKAGLTHSAGAVYDMIAPSRDATRPVGEFNRSRIVVRGNRVEHWLNGVRITEGDLGSKEVLDRIAGRWKKGSPVYNLLAGQPKRDCPIALQNHGDDAWFRNIKIRRLQ
jgi:hypothetical protein